MDRKLSVVANVKYQSPKGKGAAQLKGLLRYVQYRDDRDGHIPQRRGLERWVDRGLGNNFQTIAASCEEYKSEHVQAFTWVINPNPDLMAFVPEKKREQFIRELTEVTLEQFFEAREMDVPEYAYAIHRRETGDHRDNPHSHIILPGTYHSWADGSRLPLYMNRYKKENHIEMLHEAAQQQMDVLMQRYVGLDWEQRYDALMAERQPPNEPEIEAPPETILLVIPTTPPDAVLSMADDIQLQVWIGVQEDLFTEKQRVGFICRWEEPEIGEQQDFIAPIEHLTSQQAEQLTAFFHAMLATNPALDIRALMEYGTEIAERLQQADIQQPTSPSLDL
ncbi:MAG: hypothetical protein HY862_04720 [Chloroflexi bacterium]|nr:hypothetical protein [Chloroflexota bacterium]